MDYFAPNTLNGVLDLIAQPGYQVLSSDQSLVSTARPGRTLGAALVSLRKVPGLAGVQSESGQLGIGCSVSYADLLAHPATGHYPALTQALAAIPEPHLRNHCTLGGALHFGGQAHAPVLAALMALDAEVLTLSRSASNRTPLQAYSQAGQRVAVESGQLVSEISIPAAHLQVSRYLKLDQLQGRGPARGLALAIRPSATALADIRLVLAGFTEQPIRLTAVEAALVGHPLSADRINTAAGQITAATLPIAAGDTPPAYLHHLATVLIRRALGSLLA